MRTRIGVRLRRAVQQVGGVLIAAGDRITMRVNGDVRGLDNTRSMIFSVDELLNFIDLRVAFATGGRGVHGNRVGCRLQGGRAATAGGSTGLSDRADWS